MFRIFRFSPTSCWSVCGGLLATALLPACAPVEPVNGCALAAANRREVLRAHDYLNTAIPARILALHYQGVPIYHAALIYRIPEGWCAYDDTWGTRRLYLPADASAFPPPLLAARAASPGQAVDDARWLENTSQAKPVASAGDSVR